MWAFPSRRSEKRSQARGSCAQRSKIKELVLHDEDFPIAAGIDAIEDGEVRLVSDERRGNRREGCRDQRSEVRRSRAGQAGRFSRYPAARRAAPQMIVAGECPSAFGRKAPTRQLRFERDRQSFLL